VKSSSIFDNVKNVTLKLQLHIAACNGYVYVTEFLLAQHVVVNVPDDDGWMPLHCAACWGQVSQSVKNWVGLL